MRIFLLSTLMTLALLGSVAHGADYSFVEIAPIPGVNGGNATDGTLDNYINSMFRVALAVGAVIAVLYIAIGGFEYMLSEAMSNKAQGRKRIQSAFAGLAILLLVYLVLYIVNPDIVRLNIFT